MKSIAVPVIEEDPSPVTDFVIGELEQYDCSSKALYHIEASIEEIVVNIVRYSGLSPDDTFEVRCEVLEDPLRAVVQFLDRGIPFNPLAKKDPDTSPEALSNRVDGLGIFMVKKMMDDVSYVYEDGKNTLTLVKNLQ